MAVFWKKDHKRTNKTYKGISLITRASSVFTEYYYLWYKDGKKIVPNIKLNPMVILIWFLDDGNVYINKYGKLQFKLSTDGFEEKYVYYLVDKLMERYGTKFSINRSGKGYIITSYGDAIDGLIKEIDNIFIGCMERKAKWRKLNQY